MPLITFNIFFIIFCAMSHIVLKPIVKKKYPLKLLGTIILAIITMAIYDLVPLGCWVIIQLNKYFN